MEVKKVIYALFYIFTFGLNTYPSIAEENINDSAEPGKFHYINTTLSKTGDAEFVAEDGKLPIGMNIPSVTYYNTSLMFNDVMKTADLRADDWSSGNFSEFPVDKNGYPTQVPYTIDGVQYTYLALINSFYTGEYILLYDGEGEVTMGGVSSKQINGIIHFTLPGEKRNIWVKIKSVVEGNHVRNIRIIPDEYIGNEGSMPVFNSDFITGLQPFHALRFMDTMRTNGSINEEWEGRAKKTDATQGSGKGIAWEYIIDLSNQLKADPWICVPHMASDDYIIHLATLFKNNLDPSLKVYVEYSNEVWNWQFRQAGYVLNNAPDHPNSHVSSDLAAIGPAGSDHPEKDAYMMARTFRLFEQVFGAGSPRLVKVATGQHAWVDNSRRILKYLFETDGIGADAFSVAGYFSFDAADHDTWNAMAPSTVTAEMVLESARTKYPSSEKQWTLDTAAYVNQYGVDYLVYEGGQHMQPYKQSDWGYNHAVYDAQISPGMYDLYMETFTTHMQPDVNCKLFMAFSYIGERESKYGSWGHLENLQQLNSLDDLMINAPKYKALLDVNTPH